MAHTQRTKIVAIHQTRFTGSNTPKLRLRNWKILQRSLDPLSAGFKGVRWRRRGKDRVDIGRGKEGKVGKGKEGVGRQEWRGEEGVERAVLQKNPAGACALSCKLQHQTDVLVHTYTRHAFNDYDAKLPTSIFCCYTCMDKFLQQSRNDYNIVDMVESR